MTSSRSLRPLSAIEHGLWQANEGAPLNFTTNARITGPLTAEVLRAALPAVRARHAHLRARIAGEDPGGLVFLHDAVPPLELEVVAGGDWVKQLEHQINHPFAAQGPLARFTLVELGPDEAFVLVTIHHCVGDGMSGAFLMRDLIEACAQVLAGQTPRLADLPESGAIDAGLPPSARGVRAWGHHLRLLLKELWVAVRSGRPLKVRRDQDLFAHSRRARVMPMQLDAAFTDRLSARARAERTTVHGALSAAMLLGTLADAKVERAGINFGSPVNVRALLEPAVGEQLGFYVSMALYRAVLSQKTPFWDVARAVRRDLEGKLGRGDQLSMLSLMPLVMKAATTGARDPRQRVERFEKVALLTTGLTNLGRLGVPTRYGPLTLEECHFAACPSALGDFMATATSLHGRIFWNFVWPDPVLTEAHAKSLVGGIVDRLKLAVG